MVDYEIVNVGKRKKGGGVQGLRPSSIVERSWGLNE